MQPSAASSVVEAEQTDVAPTTTPRPPAANNALVPVEKIRTDGGTQPREQIDQGTIDRYAEDYENGAVFPLIVVFNDGNNYWLASGFHRFFAFRKANPEAAFITVDLRAGTQREAVLFSLGENATHGLFRSNADKRRAVLTLLNDEEWSQMSDNAVASKARVSQPFVSSLRRELSQNVLSDRTGYDDADVVTEDRDETTAVTSQPTTRIGRDGVVRETKNIGRTAARVLAQDDVIPAENDIRVDEDNQDPQGTVAEPPESGPMLAVKETTKADAELWQNGTIELHLRLNPQGKAIPGTAIVSGKHTNTNAVFLSCTAADLQPMPPAIKQIIKMIQEAFENRGKSQPAATKPKKKTTVARGKKKVTKRTAKPSPKKKPTTRAKQKTRVKARKK